MELVAGDFYRIATSEASLDMLCEYTQCNQAAFPYDIPGITDQAQCDSDLLKYLEIPA